MLFAVHAIAPYSRIMSILLRQLCKYRQCPDCDERVVLAMKSDTDDIQTFMIVVL